MKYSRRKLDGQSLKNLQTFIGSSEKKSKKKFALSFNSKRYNQKKLKYNWQKKTSWPSRNFRKKNKKKNWINESF